MFMTEVNCLILDDSRMSGMIVKRIIETTHPDWKIEEAGDAQQALDKASEKNFELIFLDYNMPVMNGGEVAEILFPRFPDAKIA